MYIYTQFFAAALLLTHCILGEPGTKDGAMENYDLEEEDMPKKGWFWEDLTFGITWTSASIMCFLRAYYLYAHEAKKAHMTVMWGLFISACFLTVEMTIWIMLFANCANQDACDNRHVISISVAYCAYYPTIAGVFVLVYFMATGNAARAQVCMHK